MTLTTAHMPYQTGHLFAPPDPRTVRLSSYYEAKLPEPPQSADWLGKVRSWPMLGNDELGDCEPAACAHLAQAWTTYAGLEYDPTVEDVVAAYGAVGGYDPDAEQADGSNPTDVGCESLPMLGYWRRTGIGGHRIAGYAALDVADHREVKAAINAFGGILVAVNLPLSAGMQTKRRTTWRPTLGPAAAPGSWGGHAIHVGGYGPRSLTAVTWGALQRLTWAFWDEYVVEAYGIVSHDQLNTAGKNPSGLDMVALMRDLHDINRY